MQSLENSLNKVRLLKDLYDQNLIPRLHEHEVNPNLERGGRDNYLYFTLPVCINFQRSSPAMWQSALKTFNDPETNYLFYPEKTIHVDIKKVRADLLKHKLALQPNKHIHIWQTISSSLYRFYNSDPREIMREAEFDAIMLAELFKKYKKDRFPYLSGAKLSNYWPYILSNYTDLTLKNDNFISIIPDTHVIQSSIKLGLVPDNASPITVELAWRQLLKYTDIRATQMHPILWNWSRNNFQPDVS